MRPILLIFTCLLLFGCKKSVQTEENKGDLIDQPTALDISKHPMQDISRSLQLALWKENSVAGIVTKEQSIVDNKNKVGNLEQINAGVKLQFKKLSRKLNHKDTLIGLGRVTSITDINILLANLRDNYDLTLAALKEAREYEDILDRINSVLDSSERLYWTRYTKTFTRYSLTTLAYLKAQISLAQWLKENSADLDTVNNRRVLKNKLLMSDYESHVLGLKKYNEDSIQAEKDLITILSDNK